jgi:hypothetical protein
VPLTVQLAIERKRAIRRRRVLHVDPDEVAAGGGVHHDRLQVLSTEARVELEPEARELHGDVRVEVLLVDPREHLVVLPGERACLVGARDLLAEHVDGRELPFRVQPLHDPDRVVDARPRDVARREPLHDGLRYSRQQPDDRAVDKRHGRAGSYCDC